MWNRKYQGKINHISKLIETIFIILKCKNCGQVWSIFHSKVNSELMFNEQWMKMTSKDFTWEFFFVSFKNFLSKIWAAKFRVQLIFTLYLCTLSAGVYIKWECKNNDNYVVLWFIRTRPCNTLLRAYMCAINILLFL